MKHTQGEWIYNPTEIGPQKVIYSNKKAEGVLATVDTTGDISIKEIEANAKLIASAPELLEALEDITSGSYDHTKSSKANFKHLQYLANEAIKKATT